MQWEQTGLIVGKNFTIQSGGARTEIDIHRLSVGGATRIITGQGSDIITINDSSFAGPTTILTGGGADGVLIETQAGVFGTQFAKALKVDLGAGNDVLELGISGDDLHRGRTAVPRRPSRRPGQRHAGPLEPGVRVQPARHGTLRDHQHLVAVFLRNLVLLARDAVRHSASVRMS